MIRTGFIAGVLLLTLTAGAQTNPSAQPDRAALWRADLAALAEILPERHISLFAKLPRADFDRAVADLDSAIPELSDDEVHVRLLQLIASIGDAHTQLGWSDRRTDFHRFPIAIGRLKDGYFIRGAVPEHQDLIARKIVRVGNLDVAEAAKRVATLFPHENDAWREDNVCWWLTVAEPLKILGITDDAQEAVFMLESGDGARQSVRLRAISSPNRPGLMFAPSRENLRMPRLREGRLRNYWFERVPEHKAIFVRYDRCQVDATKPILDFANELFQAVDEDAIERVIVDLRFNSGGNSVVFQPVILGLAARPKINQKGRLFVLIGPGTFSSGMMNALDFRNRTRALLVGQPTGQKPNSFGEQRSFEVPSKRFKIFYSTKRFILIKDDDPPSLIPDIVIEPTGADFFSGRDLVLEQVLEYRDK